MVNTISYTIVIVTTVNNIDSHSNSPLESCGSRGSLLFTVLTTYLAMASELLRIGISFVFYHRTSVFPVFLKHMSEYWQSGVLSSSFKCNFDTWILWCFHSSQRSRAFSRCSLYSWLQTNQIQVSKLHVKTRVNLHLIPNSHVNYTWNFCN